MSSPDPSLGETAYNTYADRMGWVSRFTQERLPMFGDQATDIQLAWEAAANAAVDQYEETQRRGPDLPDDTDWDFS